MNTELNQNDVIPMTPEQTAAMKVAEIGQEMLAAQKEGKPLTEDDAHKAIQLAVNPARYEGEDFEEYKTRRRQANKAIKDGTFTTLLSQVEGLKPAGRKLRSKRAIHRQKVAFERSLDLAKVAPKPAKARTRKPKASIPPTWPKTENQKAQSRPIIVLGIVREMEQVMKDAGVPRKKGLKEYFGTYSRQALHQVLGEVQAAAAQAGGKKTGEGSATATPPGNSSMRFRGLGS